MTILQLKEELKKWYGKLAGRKKDLIEWNLSNLTPSE